MRVWRICRQPHAVTSLTGRGGLYVSGRWHHRGQPIVYTSATPSLAALEVLVHVDLTLAPADLRLIELDVPDGIDIETCDPALLAPDWQVFPAPVVLQDFGSQWLMDVRTPVLSVPSAVLAIERNYLINPAHPDASRIRIVQDQAFSFDPRLIKS
jgi:RES domain-containing protein